MVGETALPASLTAAAIMVLTTADPAEKAVLTHAYAAAWRDGRLADLGAVTPPTALLGPIGPS